MLNILFITLLFSTVPQDDKGSAHTTKLNADQAVLFNKISDGLICQCGCNLVVSQCGHVNCPSAVPIRNTIENMILEGRSEAQIFDHFMNEYSFRGNPPVRRAILSQPATEGFDLLAWIAPFIILVVAGIVLIFIIRRASRKKPGAVPDNHLGEVDTRVEEELKKLD